MKKFFFALAAVAALAFVGCSDDDDDKGGNGLTGTTWECYESNDSGGYLRDTFAFKKNGNVTWSESWSEYGEQGSDVTNGTYTYSAPNLTMQFPGEKGGFHFTGTVKGNSMQLYDADGDYFYGTFTKK